jgi:tetratricopeptide (TPR) repeat protein
MNRNDFANAEIWARQAMARAAQLGDIPNQAKSIYRLGAIAVQQGAFDEGRTYFEQSLALYQPLDDRKGIAWNLFGLGHAFLHQHGACAEAKSYFEQALTLFRELGDIRGTSSTLMSLTQFAIASGDQASALAYGEEALSQFDQLGDRRGSAVTTHLLGETAFYRKDDAAAMRYFVSSRERALAIGFTQVAVFSMIYLGQLAIKQGDLLTGQIYLTEGLALCRQLGEPNNISIILLRLSTVYAAQGEQETALAYASEGLELAISIKSAPVMLAILGTIALYRLTKMMHSPAQRALITGLAEAHRSTDVDTREQILELKTELLSVLPPQMLALFLTQSAGRDLETTARSILADSRR